MKIYEKVYVYLLFHVFHLVSIIHVIIIISITLLSIHDATCILVNVYIMLYMILCSMLYIMPCTVQYMKNT